MHGYHVVTAIIKHLGLHQREVFIFIMENPIMLISFLKSKYGTFVAQACLPFLQARTIIAVLNTLLGSLEWNFLRSKVFG